MIPWSSVNRQYLPYISGNMTECHLVRCCMTGWQTRFVNMAGRATKAGGAFDALREREVQRRTIPASAVVEVAKSVAKSVALTPQQALVSPVEAVALVQQRLPSIFVVMVESRKGLLEALKDVGVESATFFTALDASQELRAWYRGVKAAQATLDIEEAEGVLQQMDTDASDELMGNGVRNAKMQAAKLKLDQYRWMAQRLLPALFGEKTQTDVSGKVEIVVRRETKKAIAQAVEE